MHNLRGSDQARFVGFWASVVRSNSKHTRHETSSIVKAAHTLRRADSSATGKRMRVDATAFPIMLLLTLFYRLL